MFSFLRFEGILSQTIHAAYPIVRFPVIGGYHHSASLSQCHTYIFTKFSLERIRTLLSADVFG